MKRLLRNYLIEWKCDECNDAPEILIAFESKLLCILCLLRIYPMAALKLRDDLHQLIEPFIRRKAGL